MINLLCHCLKFQHFFSFICVDNASSLFLLVLWKSRRRTATIYGNALSISSYFVPLWSLMTILLLLPLASPFLAVRADRMRGGRNKFGPMYKRDRARKLQILRQRQLALQAIRGSIGGGSSSSGTAADVGQSQLSPTGYPPYSNMHIKQEIQIPQVRTLFAVLNSFSNELYPIPRSHPLRRHLIHHQVLFLDKSPPTTIRHLVRPYLATMAHLILPQPPTQLSPTRSPIPSYGWLIQPPHHHIHLVRKHLALIAAPTHRVRPILLTTLRKL